VKHAPSSSVVRKQLFRARALGAREGGDQMQLAAFLARVGFSVGGLETALHSRLCVAHLTEPLDLAFVRHL
jgi:hypothetical protein